MKKKTTQEFIKQAIEVHGDKFDYSPTNYVNAKTNVDIICKHHGIFSVLPNNHLRGDGCPVCRYVLNHKVVGVGNNDLNCINENQIAYNSWREMIKRCYDAKSLRRRSSYIDCYVCEEWLSYKNFLRWFEDNYVDGWELDKDILDFGNRIYAPNKCCFVPKKINIIFSKNLKSKNGLPLGVSFNKKLNKYRAECSINGVNTYLGLFNTAEEAFQTYKEAKEEYIQCLAEEYKDRLNDRVYDALRKFTISK